MHAHVLRPARGPQPGPAGVPSFNARSVGEAVTWWTLVARCQARRDVLLGLYEIPVKLEHHLTMVLNPWGQDVSEQDDRHAWKWGVGQTGGTSYKLLGACLHRP